MPDNRLTLPDPAIALLLQAIELPGARIAGVVLQDHFGQAATPLLTSKLLVPDGHSSGAAPLGDHDDFPIELLWFTELNGLGYRSVTGKVVKAPSDRIAYFKVDVASVIERFASPLLQGARLKPVALVEDIVWDLGPVTIGNRSSICSLWFARRLHDNSASKKLDRTMRDRPSADLRIVLTSTPSHRIDNNIVGNHMIVPVSLILAQGAGLTIDRSLLVARVRNPYQAHDAPIQHSADYGSVCIHGKTYKFVGPKQRCIVRLLLQALEARSPRCSTTRVLLEADFKSSVNTLAKAFSGRVDWRDFMAEADGMCWAFL